MADSTITNLPTEMTDIADGDWFIADNTDAAADTQKVSWQTIREAIGTVVSGSAVQTGGVNLVKNYPSLERADSALPDWWEEEDANVTLTEEDATGLSIPQKYERVLKIANGAAGGGKYIYQRFTYADEPMLDVSTTVVSGGAWVYTGDAGTVTIDLVDSAGGSIGASTTTTTDAWTWVEVTSKTLGAGTYLDLRVDHSANSASVCVAMPTLNTGPQVMSWRSRGLRQIDQGYTKLVDAVDRGGDQNFVDVDCTSSTSGLCVLVQLRVSYYNSTESDQGIRVRRNGSSGNSDPWNATPPSDGGSFRHPNIMLTQVDDSQIFEYASTENTGAAVEAVTIYIKNHWEWE